MMYPWPTTGRTAMFAELFRKTFRDQRWGLLGWSCAMAFISLLSCFISILSSTALQRC